ncbi:hypothetical protein QE152_g19512 [Popillia japonica]|uniref:Uncharacterized protein n=1 Tax=Popillia japonica TaxID=7064 RepID=A0AAW1KNW4_POPJA
MQTEPVKDTAQYQEHLKRKISPSSLQNKNMTPEDLFTLKNVHYPYHSLGLRKHSCYDTSQEHDHDVRPVTRRNPSDMPDHLQNGVKMDSPKDKGNLWQGNMRTYAHFTSHMNSATFDNLHVSFNNGEIKEAQIVHYRIGHYLHINLYAPEEYGSVVYLNNATIDVNVLYAPEEYGSVVYLNNATIDVNVVDRILINTIQGELRIIFNTPEEKLFFINEIENNDSSSSSDGSTDSGNSS